MEGKRREGRAARDGGRRSGIREEGEERRRKESKRGVWEKEGLGQHLLSQKKIRQIEQDSLCPEHFCLTSLRLHFAITVYLGTSMMTKATERNQFFAEDAQWPTIFFKV